MTAKNTLLPADENFDLEEMHHALVQWLGESVKEKVQQVRKADIHCLTKYTEKEEVRYWFDVFYKQATIRLDHEGPDLEYYE
jgi:hypothetical protein